MDEGVDGLFGLHYAICIIGDCGVYLQKKLNYATSTQSIYTGPSHPTPLFLRPDRRTGKADFGRDKRAQCSAYIAAPNGEDLSGLCVSV